MIRRSYMTIFAVLFVALLLAGCASGVPYAEFSKTMPPPPANDGRIFVYRTSILGGAIQPSVRLNGTVVGSAVPGGFFYVDRPEGNYTISTETEVKRDVSFRLSVGQIRYVRLEIGMGFFVGHVIPVLVENAEGSQEILDLRHIEQ
jgi:Protein of unknown function (DUF2846)